MINQFVSLEVSNKTPKQPALNKLPKLCFNYSTLFAPR